jgi:hypothetical protein
MAQPERTTGETIYQAILDLHNAGRLIDRPTLTRVTGIKMGVIDDHVTRMVEAGRLRRIGKGCLEIVEQFPANRKVGKVVMRDGMIEITVGTESMEITPSEAGLVGQMLMGEATMYAQLRGDRDVSDQVTRLERDAKESKRRIGDMAREISRLLQGGQRGLSFD